MTKEDFKQWQYGIFEINIDKYLDHDGYVIRDNGLLADIALQLTRINENLEKIISVREKETP